jgi:hypothetical protein
MLRVLAFLTLYFATCPAIGQVATPKDPLAAISWLSGNWQAEAREPGSTKPPTHILSHYNPVLDGKAITIETSFDGVETYRGIFGYDGEKKAVAFWYLAATGESVSGTVAPTPGYLLLDFTSTKPDGARSHLQTHLIQIDPDHYKWELYADPKGSGFVKLFDLIYSRVK